MERKYKYIISYVTKRGFGDILITTIKETIDESFILYLKKEIAEKEGIQSLDSVTIINIFCDHLLITNHDQSTTKNFKQGS